MAIATSKYKYLSLLIIGILLFVLAIPAAAQTSVEQRIGNLDTLWLIIAGCLVFFMNAGFAMLESGLCQTRNSVNILAKNLIVFCISALAFWISGFGLMFGNGNSLIGVTGFFFQAFNPPLQPGFDPNFTSLQVNYPTQPTMVLFFFQLVFAGTTATIVSGTMAERVKFWAFFWFSFLLVAIAYPLTGRWVWNPNGWLASNFNFIDFAGSTVVHSVGGMAGLAGAILIGPRRGWQGYNPDAVVGNRFSSPIEAFNHHNLSLSTLGCLILWLGWLGFNGGSASSLAEVPHVIATTMFAGASGGIFILLLRGLRSQKLQLPLVINGILGGLVSITASSAYVSLAVAILIGAVGSLGIIAFEWLLKKLRIDDPVGAIPVHLGCGIWGTLAAGFFADRSPSFERAVIPLEQIVKQIVGILAVNLTILVLSLLFWAIVGLIIYGIESIDERLKPPVERKIVVNSRARGFDRYWHYIRSGIRVSQQEEREGSDGTFA